MKPVVRVARVEFAEQLQGVALGLRRMAARLEEEILLRAELYPKVIVDALRSAVRIGIRAMNFAVEAGSSFVEGVWTGQLYPISGPRIYIWGKEVDSSGAGHIVGRLAAIVVMAMWEAIRTMIRWRWVSTPVVAILWVQCLKAAGILHGKVGAALGFLADSLTLPAAGVMGIFGVWGLVRTRLPGRRGLRDLFVKRPADEGEE